MRKKLFAVGVLSVVLVLCLTGFAIAKVKVIYWDKWTGFEQQAMEDVVSKFNAMNPDIEVDYIAVGQMEEKTLVAIAAGDPPDIAGLWSHGMAQYAAEGAVIDLTDMAAEAGITRDRYIPIYWDLQIQFGRLFSLPSTVASIGLYYNVDHFKEAGLDPSKPPKTIDELDVMAEKMTKRDTGGNITQMGFIHSWPGWWKYAWGYYFGGRLVSKDLQELTVNSPENIAAYEWVASYPKKYGGVEKISLFQSGFGNFSSPTNPFINGTISMELQGVWNANFIERFNPDLDWRAAPFPSKDGKIRTLVETDTLAIPIGAKHVKEAWEFMKYSQTQEGMEILCKGQGKHSPLIDVSPGFYKDHPHKQVKLFADMAKSPDVFYAPKVPLQREIRDEVIAAADHIWLMEKTPKEALDDVVKRMERKYKRALRTWKRR